MNQYTMTLDVEQTINGDPVALHINGRQALPTHVIAAETYANGTVYVTASNALRALADFQRKIGTVYFNGQWFFFRNGELTPCASEESAISLGTQLAQTPTPPADDPTDTSVAGLQEPTEDTPAPDDFSGPSWMRETIQDMHDVAATWFAVASVALLAICLLTSQPASAAPTTSPDIAPTGCTITHAWEDGSRIATCQDGKVWTYDPDGLGPACPKTSAHYTRGWHTARATRHAQHACTREIRH